MFCFRERLVDQQINVSALHVIFRYTMIYMNITVHNLLTVLYISYGTGKDNFLNTQEPLQILIISFILMTLMCDSTVIL